MAIGVKIACMADIHDEMRAWLQGVLVKSGMSPYALARKAGVSTTTITRGLDPTTKHTLSSPTIAKIRAAIGEATPAPTMPVQVMTFQPVDDEELHSIGAGQTGDGRVDEAMRFLLQNEPALVAWRVSTRALETAGYLPGDVVMMDPDTAPIDGDAVIAAQTQGGLALRVFQKPYLVSAAADRVMRRPLLVDDMSVSIRGVVVAMFRPRRGHLIAA